MVGSLDTSHVARRVAPPLVRGPAGPRPARGRVNASDPNRTAGPWGRRHRLAGRSRRSSRTGPVVLDGPRDGPGDGLSSGTVRWSSRTVPVIVSDEVREGGAGAHDGARRAPAASRAYGRSGAERRPASGLSGWRDHARPG